MADVPFLFSDLAGVISTAYRPEVVRTLNRRSTLMKTLRISPSTAPVIFWDIEESGMSAETFTDGDAVANAAVDAISSATLRRGLLRVNFSVGDEAIANARLIPSGPGSLVDLASRQYTNSLLTWVSAANVKLFSSSSGVIGLDTALLNTSSYAGIDRTSTHATFRAYYQDPGSPTAPTLKMIRGDLSAIYDQCGETPDLAFCPSAVWNKIAALFDDVRRYTVETVMTARGLITLDGSAAGIVIDGCVFLKDKDATANTIYYLNSNYVDIEYVNLAPQQQMDAAARVLIADDGFGQVPVGLYLKHLGALGASERFSTEGSIQIVVRKPNACGRRVNVSTT